LLKIRLSSEFETLLHAAERTRRLIWLALASSILLIIGLAAALIPGANDPGVSGAGAHTAALAPFHFAAMALAIISLLTRSYGLSDRRLEHIIREPATDRGNPAPGNGVPPALSEPEFALWRLFGKVMPIHLIGWSVNELIILLGLAAAWFAGRFDAVYPFAFMAAVLHVLMFPRFEPFARRAEQLGLLSGPMAGR
jgi:hypothetical protein